MAASPAAAIAGKGPPMSRAQRWSRVAQNDVEVFAIEVSPGRSEEVLPHWRGLPIESISLLPSASDLFGAEIWVIEAAPSVTNEDFQADGILSIEGSAEHVFHSPRPAFPSARENTTPGIEGLDPAELQEVIRPVPVNDLQVELPLGAPSLALGPEVPASALDAGTFEQIMEFSQARTARRMVGGEGSIIVFIDSGIDGSRIPISRQAGGFSDSPDSDPWVDDYGHGTMVALTAAGDKATSGVDGVDPEAKIFSIKLRGNRKKAIPTASILKGMDKALQVANETDRRVILNNSWGLYGCKQLFHPCNILITRLLRAADEAGKMITTWSVGNNRELCDPNAVTGYCMNTTPWGVSVGAVDSMLEPQRYSAVGGQCYPLAPTVVAPTFGVLPWGSGFRDFGSQGGGTSQVAPQAAGALSLMSRAFPDAEGFELRAALRSGALPLNKDRPFEFYDPMTGSGLLRIADSIRAMPTARDHPSVEFERAFPTTIGA